jgi:hypothetical protein
MMEGMNSSMMHCMNFCKCHNVPLVHNMIKKEEKERIAKEKKKK